jgi:hypothetical protein
MAKRKFILVLVFSASIGIRGLSAQGDATRIAQWPMDEGSGTVVHDASGRAHHGTLTGNSSEWEWVNGVRGKALFFHGSDTHPYVHIPNHSDFNFSNGSFSIEAWVKIDAFLNAGYGEVVFGSNWASSVGIVLGFGSDSDPINRRRPCFNVATGSSNMVAGGSMAETDAWIHLVGVRDAGQDKLKLYVNGILAGEKTDLSDPVHPTDWSISGQSQTTWSGYVRGCFHGTIDEVSIYNRALTGQDVWSRYSELFPQSGTIQIEAENGIWSGGTVDGNYPGYTGTGFVNLTNTMDSYLEWTVNLPKSGVWDILFRYANGSANNRSCAIAVDGNITTGFLDFLPKGGWDVWAYSDPVRLSLPAGNHKLRITGKTSESAPNIDHIKCFYHGTNSPPAVFFNSPTDSSYFPSNSDIFVKIMPSDNDGRVVDAKLYNGGSLLHTFTFPYGFNWNNVPKGNYVLTATVTDDDGATASSLVHVFVTDGALPARKTGDIILSGVLPGLAQNPGPAPMTGWYTILYKSNWQIYFDNSGMESDKSYQPALLTFLDLPKGNYFVYTNARLSGMFPEPPFNSAWFPEYYHDSAEKMNAAPVAVESGKTTHITMELDRATFIVVDTSPKSLPFKVDGTEYTAPKIFRWRQSDTHALSVDSSIAMPDGRTYTFKGWSNNGKRIQNYVVPPPEFWQVADTVSALFDTTGTGTIKVTLIANSVWSPGFEDHEKFWYSSAYNTGWQVVKEATGLSSPYLPPYHSMEQSKTLLLKDISPGNYYVKGDASLSIPLPFWYPEYYDNSPNQSGATLVHVNASDTTRITITLDWPTVMVIVTNPKPFQISVDGSKYATPRTFGWRQSEIHSLGADEYVDIPGDPIRYVFREWRHGGSRVQNYTVPAPKFNQVTDTLVARFDYYSRLEVQSRYGHPQGSGWYKNWTEVMFSVEDSVIEYSDHSFKFPKPSDLSPKDSLLHLFNRWEGIEGHQAYSGKDNPARFTIYGNTVEKAVWKNQFPLVVSTNDTAMGKVSVQPPGLWQNEDSTVALRALPKTGYRFLRWEGSATDTASLVKVKMDTSKKVAAVFSKLTGVAGRPAPVPASDNPETFRLYPNYPNPFNPGTEIRFDMPVPERVRIEVYSLIGKRVAVLADGAYGPGTYLVRWNGMDASGRPLGSGIYFCRMAAGNFVRINKMQLIR